MLAHALLPFVLAFSGLNAPSIPELASSSDRLSTLVAAAQAADMVEALAGEGPLTVFAPTNDAFGRIDEATLAALLSQPGHEALRRILAHHVVAGRLDQAALLERDEVETLAGTTLSLAAVRDRLLVGNAAVESADLAASNGIVHVIDRVLLPPAAESTLKSYLEAVVERGVPLFNNGSPEACAAVYLTALEAVAGSDGWGLTDQQRKGLAKSIQDASMEADARSQAWAYRRLINDLWMDADEAERANLKPGDRQVIFDFRDPSAVRQWNIVLDGVMGGLSTGRIRAGSDTLQFTGETSLRNNGGFSSMRAGIAAGSLGGYDTLRLRVKGDGRKWIVGTRSSAQMGADSYWTRFQTKDGEWMDVDVPIGEMERHFFGERMAGRIRPEQVGGLEFYIYDKKAGPFSLEIDSIEAVKTGG
ncbi:MAG: CIA30 family protein [Phycisphaerales bacterium]|nr:CIA30 family protein [Phycisphaerales bacterium]